MSTIVRRFQFNLQAFDKYVHSNGRYGLKNIWPSLKIKLTWLRVLSCLRILKPSSHFYWTHSGTEHYFGQFLVRLVVFLSDDELISDCCLKKWFLKPVSKFWDLQNLSTFQIFRFFCNSAAVFSCVCFLGETWPALTSLSRKNKHSS